MSTTAKRWLVVHADDLGLTTSFNQGIQEACRDGIVTSTSIRTNGSAFEEAVHEVVPQHPHLGVGLHLNIVEGNCQRKTISKTSKLCSADGRYKVAFGGLLQAYLTKDRATLAEIEEDYRSQIELALSRGLTLDHLNSHQHSHAIPPIFEIACRLAAEYSIPFVRLPKERFYMAGGVMFHLGIWYPTNITKQFILNWFSAKNRSTARDLGVLTNDYFVGIAYTGHMTKDTFISGLAALDKKAQHFEIAEVLLHPCKLLPGQKEGYIKPYLRGYVRSSARRAELTALLDGDLEKTIQGKGWKLSSYTHLAEAKGFQDQHAGPIDSGVVTQ